MLAEVRDLSKLPPSVHNMAELVADSGKAEAIWCELKQRRDELAPVYRALDAMMDPTTTRGCAHRIAAGMKKLIEVAQPAGFRDDMAAMWRDYEARPFFELAVIWNPIQVRFGDVVPPPFEEARAVFGNMLHEEAKPQYEKYCAEPPPACLQFEHAEDFWRAQIANGGELNELARAAVRVLWTPAVVTGVDSMFSVASSYMADKKRGAAEPATAARHIVQMVNKDVQGRFNQGGKISRKLF